MDSSVTIEHDVEAQCFYVEEGGERAELLYHFPAKGSVNFNRTFVPNTWRGMGIAEKLVRTGLAWARAEGYEIAASCWYADKFLKAEKTA